MTPPLPSAPPSETISETEEVPAEAEAPSRDLSAELANALGTLEGCLDAQLVGTRTALVIPVSTTFTASGRATRAECNASLPEATRRCVTERALAVTLPAPIDDAPRTVHTTVTLQVHREDSARTAPSGTQSSTSR